MNSLYILNKQVTLRFLNLNEKLVIPKIQVDLVKDTKSELEFSGDSTPCGVSKFHSKTVEDFNTLASKLCN